ncbi:sulfate permease [Xylariaceae sp. FL1272]|nr:sulfate permease [Xylariaceae sp. FL1272]
MDSFTRRIENDVDAFREELRTDPNFERATHYAHVVPKKLPSATKQYFLNKLPIVQWLPRYSPSWLAQDFMAGLTIGVMLIPQGLSYAKIATIPIEHGLYSSWLPAAIAVFLGTSKDLSSGPTSLMGLLTSEIVADLKDEYAPADIASAVAFMCGVYGLVVGLLNLGFLLDFVSIPVLTGFISATALTIGTQQLGSLTGLSDTPSQSFSIIGNVLRRLPHWDGPTSGVGFGGIFILYLLERMSRKWGKKHFIIRYIGSSRAIIVLILFTLISYLVNRNRGDDLLWSVSMVDTDGIPAPKAQPSSLISKVAARALAPWIAASLEHQAVGRAFGRKNHYSVDETQEFNYLGVTNLVNSFFGAMPVGGAMSRTAVNSECGVRSPLNGVVTSAFIVLTIFVFSPALYWLPKATLAAIIIMAVFHLFGPFSLIWRYYRISLADYIAFNVAFFVTTFTSSPYGIGSAVGWSIIYTLLRAAFVRPEVSSNAGSSNQTNNRQTLARMPTHDGAGTENTGVLIPEDTVVVTFKDALLFPNAQRNKRHALESIQLVYPSIQNPNYRADNERSWSVAAERRLERLRKERNIVMKDMPLSVVVFDMTLVPFIDTTGITALAELKDDIRRNLGNIVEVRLVGLNHGLRDRFKRTKWPLSEADDSLNEGSDVVYPSIERAVADDRESLKGVVSEKDS